jgi:hypothetical protein
MMAHDFGGSFPIQHVALMYDTDMKDGGQLELDVPLAPGVHATVFVIESTNGASHDLLSASQSGLEFWDNPLDDEDWNNA